jgi:serine phosphatase RsbU (regulator of sigma subunit)
VAALVFGAASRPYPGETVSGDAWFVDRHEGICRLTVVDGLGHGPAAATAASAARSVLELVPELQPADALRACHDAMHETRGGAISIVAIDVQTGRLSFSGVGNVDGYLVQMGVVQRLVPFRGIVGAALPQLRTFEFDLEPDWVVVMHTDGLHRLASDSLLAAQGSPQEIAERILSSSARETDDATVVVVAPGQAPVSAELTLG